MALGARLVWVEIHNTVRRKRPSAVALCAPCPEGEHLGPFFVFNAGARSPSPPSALQTKLPFSVKTSAPSFAVPRPGVLSSPVDDRNPGADFSAVDVAHAICWRRRRDRGLPRTQNRDKPNDPLVTLPSLAISPTHNAGLSSPAPLVISFKRQFRTGHCSRVGWHLPRSRRAAEDLGLV